MAEITIVIKDQDNGNISISAKINPPLRKETTGEDLTDAQHAAITAIEMIRGIED